MGEDFKPFYGVSLYANSPILRLGSTGSYVKELQQLLYNAGFYVGNIDGIFGVGTDTAVRNFQKARGLLVDGIVGNATWKELVVSNPPEIPSEEPMLGLGSTGAYVIELQQLLSNEGYYIGNIDGIFGAGTEAAVKSFQRDRGLVADEIDMLTHL